MLRNTLKLKAFELGLLSLNEEVDIEKAFLLVRDMPYQRASDRQPETIIREWRGTCSGKHYLLKALFRELGYASRVMACTTVEHIDPQTMPGRLKTLLEESNGRFVDVHNYLILELPDREMIVDATWPIAVLGTGLVVNESFVLGEDQQIAGEPIKTWQVPDDCDPQIFKDQLLQENFTPQERQHRDEFIQTLSHMMNNQ